MEKITEKYKTEYDTDRVLVDRDGISHPLVIDGYFTVYKTPRDSLHGKTKAKFKATINYPAEYHRKHPTYLDGTARPKEMVYDIVEIHNNGNIHGKIVIVTSFGVPKQFLTDSEQTAFKNIGKYILCRVATIVTIIVNDNGNLLGIRDPLPKEQGMYFGEAGGGTPYYDVKRQDLYVYHEKMCELTKADLSTLPEYLTDEQTTRAGIFLQSRSLDQIKASLRKRLDPKHPEHDSIIYHIIKHIYPLGYAELVSKLKKLFPENASVLEGVNNRTYWKSHLCEIVATEKLLTYYMKEYGFQPTNKDYGYLIDMQVPIIMMLEKCQESSHIPRGIVDEIKEMERVRLVSQSVQKNY